MAKNIETTVLVNNIIKIGLTTTVLASAFVLPGLLIALDKPAHMMLNKLEENERKARLEEAIRYMRNQKLVTGDYKHGIQITKKGKQRLEKFSLKDIVIDTTTGWDGKWRLVLFDIPEEKRSARLALARGLRIIGYQILQRSIWVHPYESKQEVASICEYYNVGKWVTYIETSHIDHDDELRNRFEDIM